jgi:two-component system, LuxR family, sensor kinase FixL
MSGVTVTWLSAAVVSWTLGAIHGAAWLQSRKAWPNLYFALTAFSVAAMGLFELAMMRAQSLAQIAELIRWAQLPLFTFMASLIGFIHFFFRAGRPWLALTIIGLRAFSLVVDWRAPVNVMFQMMTKLLPVRVMGETVVVPVGVPNPWAMLNAVTILLTLIFTVDAAVVVWRRREPGAQRRALIVGGSIVLCLLLALAHASLVNFGIIHAPCCNSLFFCFVLIAMGFELSRDVIGSARIAKELHDNLESMDLAASAARQVLWRWEIPEDYVWFSPSGRRLFGFPEGMPMTREGVAEWVHAEDREATRRKMLRAQLGGEDFQAELRMLLPDRPVRWVAAYGKVDFDAVHRPLRMRGVFVDITERKAMEMQLAEQRMELTHLTRVTMLSELSGSLAHELNQPLTAILSNAQAAQRFLGKDAVDLGEVREILKDIVQEDQRAGEIIRRMRSMLKKGEVQMVARDLGAKINDVIAMMHSDLVGRNTTVVTRLAPDLPLVSGDRVQLQQVVLNLIINGCDSMSTNPPEERQLLIQAELESEEEVRVSVVDRGTGIDSNLMERIFQPFYTTKANGLGLGLPLSQSIIAAHGGRLWAENNPGQGATFHFTLRVVKPEPV